MLRERLLDRGEELLGLYGVRRTSVEDITRAVGISKGAFYAFFDSKEELAWQALRRIEDREREEFRRILKGSHGPRQPEEARDAFAAAIRHALGVLARHPAALRVLRDPRELDLLMRRLPAVMSREHLKSDRRFLEDVRPLWEKTGLELAVSSAVATGMIRALFVIATRGDEIAGGAFPAVEEALVNAVVTGLFKQDEGQLRGASRSGRRRAR